MNTPFRQMKRPQRSALRPQYHWTDQKIEVREVGLLLYFTLFRQSSSDYSDARPRNFVD